jgi:hypothetical protein
VTVDSTWGGSGGLGRSLAASLARSSPVETTTRKKAVATNQFERITIDLRLLHPDEDPVNVLPAESAAKLFAHKLAVEPLTYNEMYSPKSFICMATTTQIQRRPFLAQARIAYLGSWLAVITGLTTLAVFPPVQISYLWAWRELAWIFFGFKSIALARHEPASLSRLGLGRLAGFVLLWPGMDLRPFLQAIDHPVVATTVERQKRWQWTWTGLANIVTGLFLFWLLGQPWARANRYVYAAIGLMSAALIVLFGVFTLLTAFWRWRGVDVDRQWKCLWLSRSLAEYWSSRWNSAFHDFVRDHVYLPLKRRLAPASALLGSFLFSGVLHDVIISVPARAGYGMPVCYFLLQGFGIWLERRWRLRPALRWLRATVFVLGPLPLLFHEPFLNNVILPQLSALRGDGAFPL